MKVLIAFLAFLAFTLTSCRSVEPASSPHQSLSRVDLGNAILTFLDRDMSAKNINAYGDETAVFARLEIDGQLHMLAVLSPEFAGYLARLVHEDRERHKKDQDRINIGITLAQ